MLLMTGALAGSGNRPRNFYLLPTSDLCILVHTQLDRLVEDTAVSQLPGKQNLPVWSTRGSAILDR
jgi:hypothetical protein